MISYVVGDETVVKVEEDSKESVVCGQMYLWYIPSIGSNNNPRMRDLWHTEMY